MSAWVIDASSIIDLVSAGPPAEAARGIARDGLLHAPDIVTLEVTSALARRSRAGVPHVEASLEEFVAMPLVRHPSHPLVPAAWLRRQNLRISDALYVELARSLGYPLLTSDARLGRAVEQLGLCDVHVVATHGE